MSKTKTVVQLEYVTDAYGSQVRVGDEVVYAAECRWPRANLRKGTVRSLNAVTTPDHWGNSVTTVGISVLVYVDHKYSYHKTWHNPRKLCLIKRGDPTLVGD